MGSPVEQLVAKMSVAELAAATGFTVRDLVLLVLDGDGSAVSPDPSAVAPETAYDTRTHHGRDALDAAIVTALRDSKMPLRALEIRKRTGGTAAQVRGRLNALIEDGRVGFRGQASGTRYFAKK